MTTTDLPPEDQPPVAPPRRVSAGLLAAAVLATVVLAIATVVAFRSGDGSETVARLDPGTTLPSSPFGAAPLDRGDEVEGTTLPPLTYASFDDEERVLSTGGRPLVVNFWASTCAPCVAEMPAIDEVYATNGDRLDVLGLQVAEAASSGRDMLERVAISYPVGRDPSGDVMAELGGFNLPTTVLITADGTIADVHTGALTAPQLQDLVDQHLLG